MPQFKPSIDVHPLIRAARWGFLIAGIFYGFNKKIFYSIKEKKFREEKLKQKAIRDAELEEERRIQSEKDVELLGRMCMPESYPPQCPEGYIKRPDYVPEAPAQEGMETSFLSEPESPFFINDPETDEGVCKTG